MPVSGHSRLRFVTIDLVGAERFIHANARLLDRHRAAVLLHGAPATPVVNTLRAYRNDDGGFGHALEPDVRAPTSETTAALHGLEVLAEVGGLHEPMVTDVADWVARIADSDGGVPFVLPSAAAYPHAPWMVPEAGGSHLTFGLVAHLTQAGAASSWLAEATTWCWRKLADPAALGAYWLKFALDFLDSQHDERRCLEAIEQLRPLLGADGSVDVPGGTEGESLSALTLSPRPGARSRALFTDDQIARGLLQLEAEQQEDGGWDFDWLAWSPGQAAEWRGLVTLRALIVLQAHGRLPGRPEPSR
ncbi:MAG: hypothetical protein QOI76_3858 [Frankiales bacterium]|nr:hypothetical protein [Frankiales bacterium]